MIGDVLKSRLYQFKFASEKKTGTNAFWVILRDIARDEILAVYPSKVDSDVIVPIYYEILAQNSKELPVYFRQTLKSNKQERFRVINRNLFTSNAFHPDGLANQKGIIAKKEINEDRKGERIIYQGDPMYVNHK